MKQLSNQEQFITDFDVHLFNEGTNNRIYDKLGAHQVKLNGVQGTHFAVWAPNATKVSVIGDFNEWNREKNPMTRLEQSGIWTLFIPEIKQGDLYKYLIENTNVGFCEEKVDPIGFLSEIRPRTASVVFDIDQYKWQDEKWLQSRKENNFFHNPLSIYEVHLGSWQTVPEEGNRWLTYRELADTLVPYVKQMEFTHVELLPVMEHPLDASWGYQPTGYFAATSRHGNPDDLMYLIDRFHQEGIGVILDWVPAHFPRDGHGLGIFDGTHIYEHADPRQGLHHEWGTYIFNYGRYEVVNFLVSNAMFWFEKYHIDGLRVDAVASMLYLDYARKDGEWVANEYGGRENLDAVRFLRKLNEVVYAEYPNALMIAEESTAWPLVARPTYLGGLGFCLKWDMGWMNDTLKYIEHEPIHRRYHHDKLTFRGIYQFSENFIMPLSHDEVVHGKHSLLNKMPGDDWQKFANLRLLLAYQYTLPGKKLLFMGGEIAQHIEWRFDQSLDWHILEYHNHKGVQNLVRDLNHLYSTLNALYEHDCEPSGFQWIDCNDQDQSILTFMRKGKHDNDLAVVILNFTPVPRHFYRIGVPRGGGWAEVLNTDAIEYGGSGVGNYGGVAADDIPHHGFNHSLSLSIPPLGVLVFKPL